ncbi:MAG UNVERIFIED_CONTAM: hypothetical protein LVQ98_02185 [Rickettsiaceae bacterium]|jgi:uncharacterized membrane protein
MDDEIDYEARYFRITTILIKLVILVIGSILLFFSQVGFVFFLIAMLPALMITITDKERHACASATICTFNLIGILPYLSKLWASASMDLTTKMLSTDISTWVVIYGCALIGQVIYWIVPPIVAKLYILKAEG